MSNVNALRIAVEPLRVVAFGAINGNYTEVGTPVDNAIRLISFSNNTDEDVFFSYNGIDDHIFVAANGFAVRDYGSNKSDPTGRAELPKHTQIWVVAVAGFPSLGSVYVECTYVSTN